VIKVLGAVLLAATAAAAHDRTTSYSSWRIDGRRGDVSVRLAALDVSRFAWRDAPDRDARLGAYVASALRLVAGGTACRVDDGPRVLDGPPGRIVVEWRVACGDGPLAIASDLLLDVAPSHLHFARVVRDGVAGPERVLSERERVWPLDAASAGSSLADYLALGVRHILSGWDHLAFLAALLLVAASLGDVARIVTGFTAGHSLTLAAAMLGWARPERGAVEALIGLSIALVAAENVWLAGARGRALPAAVTATLALATVAAAGGVGCVPAPALGGLALFAACYFALLRRVRRPLALRWGVAFLFGLVHGFGFAGVLADAGLDAARLARALVGFNGGVELGQLAAVVLVWPLLRAAMRRRLAAAEVGSAAIAGLGVFWFVSRAYG